MSYAPEININLKNNRLDEMFLNLSDNPYSQENKDFKSSLCMVYELFDEEFKDTFIKNVTPLRNTNFYIFKEGNSYKFFITPENNFDFYAKSKGSLFRFKEIQQEISGQHEYGYVVSPEIIWEYFLGLDELYDKDTTSNSFNYLALFSNVLSKLIEKCYFIPKVLHHSITFRINYELFYINEKVANIIEKLKNFSEDEYFLNIDKTEALNFLINDFINYTIFTFLKAKTTNFAEYKSAIYFIKNIEHKNSARGNNLAQCIDEWLDEIYIAKYEIAPKFIIEKIDNETFSMSIHAQNKQGEQLSLNEINNSEKPFGKDKQYVINILEKQIAYVVQYYPQLEDAYNNCENMTLDLNDVYSIMSKTSYYFQKAGIEVVIPPEFDNIIIPRASINALIKEKRKDDIVNFLNSDTSSTINLNDIFNFSYQIAIGDDKVSIQEFEELTKNAIGLISYKNMYVYVDKDTKEDLSKKFKEIKVDEMSKMELLHSSLSGKIGEYDFDFDAAYTRVLQDITNPKEIELPTTLKGELRPYQLTGFKWLYTNALKGFGSCIADDMGLGKTVQVISLIVKMKEEKRLKKPVLVICPTTLIGNWRKELQTFAPNITVSTYHGLERELDTTTDVIITTYTILRLDKEKLIKTKWGMVIIDEAQNIKNSDTSQTKAVKELKTDFRVAMTGTPVENRLNELWSIFDFINKGYLGSLRNFQKSYSTPIEKFKEYTRASRLKLAVSPFILRRLKTDKSVIADLPEKMVLDDYCYLTKSQAALYEKTLNTMMEQIQSESGINRRGMILKLITSLKQICNHPFNYLKKGDIDKDGSGKLQKLISLVENIVDNNEKVLIFTQYKEMGHILEEVISTELSQNTLFFHGSLNTKQREEMLATFQNSTEHNVLILSLKAGGLGLNLTSATNVIHYDLWWNPAVEDQATDRTYRIGQDKNVMVHRLVTIGTFEEKIDEMIKNKKEIANLAVYEGEKIITELSDKEIYEIFTLSSY
ncbi:DEAD/DEAH box helicase [bacterium]|nr:DEAD/DEAH box helicase [bacterium]